MPLSQDFANSRLEYLQSAIKNNNVVSTQFYPRFQRQYNEMYPFTEGISAAKIENPQQPVVSSTLNTPTINMVKENLKTYLTPYVGEQANVIINNLTDIQIYYYEEHFEQIQKELLKQIKIPTSITSYLVNLKMVLANDKNRNNLASLKEPEVESKVKVKAKSKPEKPEKAAPILQTPKAAAASKSRPLDYYWSKKTSPTTIPIQRMRFVSSPTNLKKAMSKQRRSETERLQNDTQQILQKSTNTNEKNQQVVQANQLSDMGHLFGSSFGLQKMDKMKKKIFGGRGIQSREIKHKKEFHKYAIDLKKLHHNILALKYLKNANNVATFHPIEISDTLKEILNNFLYDGEQIDTLDFEKLSHTEKRILKRLYSFLKIDFDFDYDDQFQKRFEVMYGSWLAGNDNKELKRELKEYIKLAVHEAIISKQEGTSMMQKLEK